MIGVTPARAGRVVSCVVTVGYLLLLSVGGSLGADGERPQRSLVHLDGTAIVRSLETGALTRLASTEGIEVKPGDLIGIGLDLNYEWRYVWTGREPEPVGFWERENGKYIELIQPIAVGQHVHFKGRPAIELEARCFAFVL